MDRTKLRFILYLVFNSLLLSFIVIIAFYFFPKLPSKIAIVVRSDGSIANKWHSYSVYVLAMIYVSIFLVSFLLIKIHDKVKFKGKKEIDKLSNKLLKNRVYDLIKEAIAALCFFMGLCILYLQVSLVKLGMGKAGNLQLIPLAFIFAVFLAIAVYYSKIIDKKALTIINEQGETENNGM